MIRYRAGKTEPPRTRPAKSNGGNLGIEAELFKTADKLDLGCAALFSAYCGLRPTALPADSRRFRPPPFRDSLSRKLPRTTRATATRLSRPPPLIRNCFSLSRYRVHIDST